MGCVLSTVGQEEAWYRGVIFGVMKLGLILDTAVSAKIARKKMLVGPLGCQKLLR